MCMRRRFESHIIVTNSHRLDFFVDCFCVCNVAHPAGGALVALLENERIGRTGWRGRPAGSIRVESGSGCDRERIEDTLTKSLLCSSRR